MWKAVGNGENRERKSEGREKKVNARQRRYILEDGSSPGSPFR